MKIIGITLDEVLRDFLGHLSYAVAKIREEDEYVVTEGEVTEFDLVRLKRKCIIYSTKKPRWKYSDTQTNYMPM